MPTAVAEVLEAPVIEGIPYRFEVVTIDRLFVDHAYQRPLTSFVEKIANRFNPALLGTLVGSERPRRAKANIALIDGQTRWEGAKRAGVPQLPLVVFPNLTREQEAEIFALIQTERRGLTSYDRFRAQVMAGKGMAPAIQGVVDKMGFKTGNQNDQAQDPTVIAAVGSLEAAFAWGAGVSKESARDGRGDYDAGRSIVMRTLRIIKEGFPEREEGYQGSEIIKGVAWYITRFEVDDDRLITRLKMVTPGIMIHRANSLKAGNASGGSTGKYMSEALQMQYAKRAPREQ